MSDENSIEYLKKLIHDQQAHIADLEKRVTAAQVQAEKAENYSRQDCLIFRGQLNIRPDKNLRDEMIRLIDFHTGVQFPSWCINTVHWLKNKKSIIIRFNNKSVKDTIYRNRVPKDVSKRGLFIHESLTEKKMALVGRCSKLRTEGKIATYYTQGGEVFIKKEKGTPALQITPEMSDAEITALLDRQPASYREAVRQTSGSGAEPPEPKDSRTSLQNPKMPDQPESGETQVKQVVDGDVTSDSAKSAGYCANTSDTLVTEGKVDDASDESKTKVGDDTRGARARETNRSAVGTLSGTNKKHKKEELKESVPALPGKRSKRLDSHIAEHSSDNDSDSEGEEHSSKTHSDEQCVRKLDRDSTESPPVAKSNRQSKKEKQKSQKGKK